MTNDNQDERITQLFTDVASGFEPHGMSEETTMHNANNEFQKARVKKRRTQWILGSASAAAAVAIAFGAVALANANSKTDVVADQPDVTTPTSTTTTAVD